MADKVTGTVTYVAQYTQNEYTVTYDIGTHATTSDQTVFPGLHYNEDTPDEPTLTVEDGWTFTGWLPTVADKVTGTVTYVAQYTQNEYTVTYDIGTHATTSDQTVFPGLHYNEDTPDEPTLTVEDGWTFTGWLPTVADKVTGTVTYVAQYTVVVYDIDYNMDGGTNNPSNPSTYTVEDPTINLLDPTKTGYTFDGWTPTDSIPAGSTGEKTFTANWTAIAYDITYNLNGGTNDPSNPSTYTVEDPTITLADPTKDGYTFLGWEPTDNIPAGSTGDKAFTATWSDPIVYSITYNLDGRDERSFKPLCLYGGR